MSQDEHGLGDLIAKAHELYRRTEGELSPQMLADVKRLHAEAGGIITRVERGNDRKD
jgi:hypothetical protein